MFGRKDVVTKVLNISLLVAVALSFAGCGDKSDLPVSDGKDSPQKAKPEVVLVAVGKESLTLDRVEKMAQLRVKLATLRAPNLRKEQRDRLQQKAKSEAIPFFVQSCVYSAYLAESGVSVPPSTKEKYKAEMAGAFKIKDFDTLAGKLTVDESALLSRQIDGLLAIKEAKKRIVAQAGITVTEKEKDDFIAKVIRMNALSAATNAAVYAKATNVWNKISSREITFEEAADDYSEAEVLEEGGEWGRFSFENLRGENELIEAIRKSSPGDVTPPVECDNGLAIIKVLEVPTGDSGTYRLARVFFKLPLSWEVPTREDAENVLRQRAENAAIDRKFNELAAKAGIVNNIKDDKKGSKKRRKSKQ